MSGAFQKRSENLSSDHRDISNDIVVNTDKEQFREFFDFSTNIAVLVIRNNVGSFNKLIIPTFDRFPIEINDDTTNINVTSKHTNPQWDIISEYIKDEINLIDTYLEFHYRNTTTVSPVRSSIHSTISNQIDELLNNNYEWDSIGYEEPSERDLNYAKKYMSKFITTISLDGYTLPLPHISNSEEGGATIRWRVGERILYFDIKFKSARYTKVWNQNEVTLVETHKLRKSLYTEIWKWLYNGQN